MIARVVPVRRLPAQKRWFDYLIPDDMTVLPGQLVEVEFMRSVVTGVIWAIDDQTTVRGPLKPLQRLLSSTVVMTTLQRQLMESAADMNFVSLGHLVTTALPQLGPRTMQTLTDIAVLPDPPADQIAVDTWWYTDRSAIIQRLAHWIKTPSDSGKVIITPTEQDAEELARTVSDLAPILVHGKLRPSEYRSAYIAALSQPAPRVIGTSIAMALPLPLATEWVIDQEEHLYHKSMARQPFLDNRRLLLPTGRVVTVTTPAPSVSWWQSQQPTPPTATTKHILGGLDQTPTTPWISYQLEQLCESLTADDRIVIMAPQHGYASAMLCRDCGLSVDCQTCHRPASWFVHDSQTICRHCQSPIALPASCPRCNGTQWRLQGLGVDRVQELWNKHWPHLTQLTIGSYGLRSEIRRIKNVRAVVLMHGDALRSSHDMATDERAWQFLFRLSSEAPSATILAQTFHPEHDFWQRWSHHEQAAWYNHELSDRLQQGLPPYRTNWILRITGPNHAEQAASGLRSLQHLSADMQVTLLPAASETIQASKLLIESSRSDAQVRQLANWLELFPYPWQFDTSPQAWFS